MIKHISAVIAALAATTLAGASAGWAADADTGFHAGDVMLRLRGLAVLPADTSSSVSPIGGKVDITNNYIPEVDGTYFLTDKIAFEVIAGTTRHGVKASQTAVGNIDLGSVWLLPPTVTAQYHFLPQEKFNPYVGAGVNYTVFYDAQKSSPINSIKYENNFGWALQAGFDYKVADHWYLNGDVKKLFVSTKADINGGAITGKVNIDPWLLGLGIGYKF